MPCFPTLQPLKICSFVLLGCCCRRVALGFVAEVTENKMKCQANDARLIRHLSMLSVIMERS